MIEVPVTAYAELPSVYTAELPAPAPPPARCRSSAGKAAVCALDGLLWLESWRALRDKANDDRAESGRLTRPPQGLNNRSESDGGDGR